MHHPFVRFSRIGTDVCFLGCLATNLGARQGVYAP